MGNVQTAKKTNPQTLVKILEEIIADYILTAHFLDYQKLAEGPYCEKMTVIVADIFNKFLDDRNIKYLEQMRKGGAVAPIMGEGKLMFFPNVNLAHLDVKNPTEKRRKCIGIARFYVKVGHVFAAILAAINPEYIYTDERGTIRRVSILDKARIPASRLTNDSMYGGRNTYSAVKNITNNICGRRLKALTPKKGKRTNKSFLRVCELNRPYESSSGFPSKRISTRSLVSEVGFPEFETLYDNKYNYEIGGFDGRTNEMKTQYLNDVRTFYKVYTGKTSVPKEIATFSQIPLADYHNRTLCKKRGILLKPFTYDTKSNIYIPYADHLKKMMNTAEENQDKLIAILNKLFVKKGKQGQEKWTIHPKLSMKTLPKIVDETRKIIMNLYIQCEKDFKEGVRLFQAVIAKKQLQLNKEREKYLEQEFNQLLSDKS